MACSPLAQLPSYLSTHSRHTGPLEHACPALASLIPCLALAPHRTQEAATNERQRADQLQERLLEKDRELARVRAQCEEERGAIRQELQVGLLQGGLWGGVMLCVCTSTRPTLQMQWYAALCGGVACDAGSTERS